MTGRERLNAVLDKRPTDRLPWTTLVDNATLSLVPEQLRGNGGLDFYRHLRCDVFLLNGWNTPHVFRSPELLWADDVGVTRTNDDGRVTTDWRTPRGTLTGVTDRGHPVKYPVESRADLDALRAVPFAVAPARYDGYERLLEQVGERGVLCLGVSSPWVVFSTCMRFEQALEWSLTEPRMVHEVLGEITERFLACLNVVLARELDTVANVGGAEQCTPPMMRPEAYAEFVTPYESKIVGLLKSHDIPVNCHCHGRVSFALGEMVAAGFDATDPVEPPDLGGDGDVTMTEARKIVGDRLTLCGNLQFEELERSTPEQIRARVREIIDTGKRRLVLSASAGAQQLVEFSGHGRPRGRRGGCAGPSDAPRARGGWSR